MYSIVGWYRVKQKRNTTFAELNPTLVPHYCGNAYCGEDLETRLGAWLVYPLLVCVLLHPLLLSYERGLSTRPEVVYVFMQKCHCRIIIHLIGCMYNVC